MVRTRHSLAEPGDDDEGPQIATPKQDVPKWMKELQIDGKETLKGEKKADQGMGVYTWRGAVYAIDENTPREWIEAEAERHQKRQRRERESSRQKSETPASVSRPSGIGKLKRRAASSTVDDDDMEEEVHGQPRSAKRRKWEVQDEEDEEEAAVEEGVEEQPVQEVPQKKPRKNLSNLRDKPARPERHYLFPTLNVQKKKRSKPKVDLPRFDTSGRGSQQTREQVEQSRQQAKERGLEVNMLPASRATSLPAVLDEEGRSHSPTFPETPKSFTMAISDRDKQTLSRIVCNITEPEANRLAATIVEIGKINARAQELQAHSEGLIEHLRAVKDRLLAKKVERSLEDHGGKAAGEAPLRHDSPAAGYVPATTNRQHQEMTPPAETEEANSTTTRMPSLSQDGDGDAPWEQSHSSSSPALPHQNLLPPISSLLPPTHRSQPSQNWSLPTTEKAPHHHHSQHHQQMPHQRQPSYPPMSTLTHHTSPAVPPSTARTAAAALSPAASLIFNLPAPTPHRHDADRAEALIHRGRFEGESQTQRKMRIRREVAILENLPDLLDRLPGGP